MEHLLKIERLQKYMAYCGVDSRRKCEEYITAGRVMVNNVTITELGFKVNSDCDKVFFDGKLIKKEISKVYIMLNKPIGYVSTVKDEKKRPTILDLVTVEERIYPIGRLDFDTEGLILLTNDGEVYNKVIHPRKSIDKTYVATIVGTPTDEEITHFCTGVDIGDYITAPAKFKVIKKYHGYTEVELKIHEGKNRQIRRMCDAINHPVMTLKRISVGNLKIGDLKLGRWRFLTESEIDYIQSL